MQNTSQVSEVHREKKILQPARQQQVLGTHKKCSTVHSLPHPERYRTQSSQAELKCRKESNNH